MNPFPRLDFGLLIAYFLPGFVCFFGLSYLSPRVEGIFNALLSKDQSFGAAFIVLAAALVGGIVVSSIRELTLDWIHMKTGVTLGQLDYGRLRDKETLAAFSSAINNTYRYYQFYGNTLVSLAFLTFVRYLVVGVDIASQKTLFLASLGALLVLFIRSRGSLQETGKVLNQILHLGEPGGVRNGKETGKESAEEKKEKGHEG